MRIAILSQVSPKAAVEEARIKLALQLQDVRVISIDWKQCTMVDCLLLLDTGGIDCSAPAFYPHVTYPPNVPGQDQAYQRFILNTLPWYKKKGIPVVGLGTSGLVVWAYLLDGKIDWNVADEQLEPFRNDDAKFLSESSDWAFQTDKYVGLRDTPSDEDLWCILHKLVRHNEGEQLAAVMIPVVAPPIIDKAKNAVVPPPIS